MCTSLITPLAFWLPNRVGLVVADYYHIISVGAGRQWGQGTALCQADDKGGWSNWHSEESSVAKAGVFRLCVLTGFHRAELKQSIYIQASEMSRKCTPPPYKQTHMHHILGWNWIHKLPTIPFTQAVNALVLHCAVNFYIKFCIALALFFA